MYASFHRSYILTLMTCAPTRQRDFVLDIGLLSVSLFSPDEVLSSLGPQVKPPKPSPTVKRKLRAMRNFLDRTRFVAYPLLVSFLLLSVDAATLAYAAQSEARPRGRGEAEPHHLVQRSRIFLERAEEASRKLDSRLPLPGKIESAEFFRKELDQFRNHLTEQFSEESESLERRRMPEETRERFQLLSSSIEGVLAEIDGAFQRVERGLTASPGFREDQDLEDALERFHEVTEEVALQDGRPLTGEELPHWAPARVTPELPEPLHLRLQAYQPPSG